MSMRYWYFSIQVTIVPIKRQQSFARTILTSLGLASSPKVFRQTKKQGGWKTNIERDKPAGRHQTQIKDGESKRGKNLSELQLRLLQLMRGGTSRESNEWTRKDQTRTRLARSQTLPSRPVLKDRRNNGERIQSKPSHFHVFDFNCTSSHSIYKNSINIRTNDLMCKRPNQEQRCTCVNRVTVNGHCFHCDHLNKSESYKLISLV